MKHVEDIIMKNPMVKKDDLVKASWISSPRSLFLGRSSFYNKQMYDEMKNQELLDYNKGIWNQRGILPMKYIRVEDLKLPENTDDLSKEDLLAPITELCLIQGSPKFCECTKETVADNYTDDELLELRKELEKGSLPPELIQLGMMNCAIYIGQ